MAHPHDCDHDKLLCPARENLLAEIARLEEAKRHFSALADAKGKENVALRAALSGALCPGGGDHTTVGDCVKAGVCGCELGHAIQ